MTRENNPSDSTSSSPDLSTLDRLLDANFNRAAEGLRVVEDVLRLAHNDAVLSRQAKNIRHALAEILSGLDSSALVLTRNVGEDVGRTTSTEQEFTRESTEELLVANMKRAQQSLRVIEECLKPFSRGLATRAEALRYELYQLEHAIGASAWGRRQLESCTLYALIDGRKELRSFEALAGELVDAAVDLIQLRDKSLNDRELMARGEILGRLTRDRVTRWIMNDRADLAVLAGADGVHLGQDDLSVAQARRLVGPKLWIGVSTHSLAQAEQAVLDGANYIGVGPIFASSTKRFDQWPGVDLVANVAAVIKLPFFAIGGITAQNVGEILDAGAKRIAVGSAIWNADSPSTAIREFRCLLNKAVGRTSDMKSV